MPASLNGGITTFDQVMGVMDTGLDGVMVGRAAYHNPAEILCRADAEVFGTGPVTTAEAAVAAMVPYIDAHLDGGGRLNQITRHMLGLFTGRPGARLWRRMLSEGAHKDGATSALVLDALSALQEVQTADALAPQAS